MLNLLEDELFGDAYYDLNYKKNVANKKPKSLPKSEDVKMLMDACIDIMNNIDMLDFDCSKEFIKVRSATATYLILFNARRGGEPVRLLKCQWEEALMVLFYCCYYYYSTFCKLAVRLNQYLVIYL